jgi:hypothetical protein
MTDDAIQRVLGKLEAGIENLNAQQKQFREEQRADNRLLFARLDSVSANGCALGHRNMESIKELQRRPERIVGIGAAIVAILSAVGSLFLWMIERMPR